MVLCGGTREACVVFSVIMVACSIPSNATRVLQKTRTPRRALLIRCLFSLCAEGTALSFQLAAVSEAVSVLPRPGAPQCLCVSAAEPSLSITAAEPRTETWDRWWSTDGPPYIVLTHNLTPYLLLNVPSVRIWSLWDQEPGLSHVGGGGAPWGGSAVITEPTCRLSEGVFRHPGGQGVSLARPPPEGSEPGLRWVCSEVRALDQGYGGSVVSPLSKVELEEEWLAPLAQGNVGSAGTPAGENTTCWLISVHNSHLR
ncbi:unnamed protein product [Arctogadus glacialis]